MPLSQEIQNEIARLSSANKNDEIIEYLKTKLKEGIASAQDVFDYAKTYVFTGKQDKPYVINATTINKLGVVVTGLEGELKNLSYQFFELAAERSSSWGNRNCADCLLSGTYGAKASPQDALSYALKSIELAQTQDEKNDHKFTLSKTYRIQKRYQLANSNLVDYLDAKFKKIQITQDKNEKEKYQQDIKNAIDFCKAIIDEMFADFKAENQDNLIDQFCRNRISELEPIISCTINHPEFLFIKQSFSYLKGKHHERLGESSLAWLAYCSVLDKKCPFHNDAVTGRIRLLKNEIHSVDVEKVSSETDDLTVDDVHPSQTIIAEKNVFTLTLPQGIPLPLNFSLGWMEETIWFHSSDKIAIDSEYQKRLGQLDKITAAVEEKLAIIKEVQKAGENPEILNKKQMLEVELNEMKLAREKFEQKYKEYTPEYRKTYRRHTAESSFFNPQRSRKLPEIIALTDKIIEQRFRIEDSQIVSIELTGKSARLFISAERLFQESVIKLSGKQFPQLGVPVAKEKPWTVGEDYYQRSGTTSFGPVECYKIGSTEIKSEHRTAPKRERLGDSFLPDHGTYSYNIYPFLYRLSNEEPLKEKQLARFMIRYSRNHQPITLEELKTIIEDVTQNDVNHFNQICFLLMEKEQAQWHSATDERYQLGMSVSQARCLIMVEAGFISLKEAFKNNVLFGVYSQTGILDNPTKVAEACQRIDSLYILFLQNQHSEDHMKFFKKYIDKSAHQCVLTRKQARLDLRQIYGGEGDTDDETGYDSDLSMSM
jgi:hypothetical protein